MPNATSAVSANGDSFPAFPKGGPVRAITLSVGVWTEFDPQRVDLHRIHVPSLAAGRVVYTSSTDQPGLFFGAAVAPAHLAIAPTYFAGVWHECFDFRGDAPVRFFFALVDAPAGATATLLAEAAAS